MRRGTGEGEGRRDGCWGREGRASCEKGHRDDGRAIANASCCYCRKHKLVLWFQFICIKAYSSDDCLSGYVYKMPRELTDNHATN